jgi:hypothetical protein
MLLALVIPLHFLQSSRLRAGSKSGTEYENAMCPHSPKAPSTPLNFSSEEAEATKRSEVLYSMKQTNLLVCGLEDITFPHLVSHYK